MATPNQSEKQTSSSTEAVMAWEEKPAFSAVKAKEAPRTSPLTTVLLVVIAVLLAAVVYLLMAGNKQAAAPAPAQPQAAAPEQEAPQEGAAEEPPSYAPSLSDPKALELVRAEPRRQEGDPYAIGKVDAPVVLIEYADFACPYCTLWAQNTKPELMRLVEEGKLRIEWRNLPVLGPESRLAAQGAVAAGNQGKFWEYYDHLFGTADPNSHPSYSEASLVEVATQLGLDVTKFSTDLTSAETVAAVQAELEHANMQLGATSTPLFVINDTAFAGAQPTEFFMETIRYQLHTTGQ
ncbi:MAG: thioredoxin domain-containing protein [Buchananella hordeovulneris]|nr:thioredoxin domain-containing protein [Buchananella hordeovulneris]